MQTSCQLIVSAKNLLTYAGTSGKVDQSGRPASLLKSSPATNRGKVLLVMKSKKSTVVTYSVVAVGLALSSATVAIARTVQQYSGICGDLPAFPSLLQKARFFYEPCVLVRPGHCSIKPCRTLRIRDGICRLHIYDFRKKEECLCEPHKTSG
jgi:hypothetical protein